MAVLPTPVFHSSSARHSLFLRLFFLIMVVTLCPVAEQAFADSPTVYVVDDDMDDSDVLIDDEDFLDENVLEDDDDFADPVVENTSDASSVSPSEAQPSASIDAEKVVTSIPVKEIEPTVSFGVQQTAIHQNPDASSSTEDVEITEEHTSFSITPTSVSSSLDRESEASYATQSITAGDKNVVYRSNDTTKEVKASKEVVISAPVVKFKVSTQLDQKTRREKTVLTLEDNRLQLDENGKRAVLIDVSALPPSYQSEAVMQLSLRYRRHCSVDKENKLASSGASLASHLVTQESAVKPFSSWNNYYLLQVDLCPERAGQVFSLYFSKEKRIRSLLSKFGSFSFYMLAATAAGRYANQRAGKIGPDGDNGGFMDTFASALPAGGIFLGTEYVREHLELYNLTGYDSDVSACVTSALLASGLNLGDSRFKSDTSQMFVSNAGRLYLRSAYFGELYYCFKNTIIDRVVYDQWHFSHNATDPEGEKVSSTVTSMLSVLGMYSYDFINDAELKAMAIKEKNDGGGNNKLELARFGNEVRGGVASSAYKGLDTFHNHLSPIPQEDDSWSGAFQRASFNLMFYVLATYVLHYSRPYELRQGPALGSQVLGSRSILAANIMEATTAYAFGQIDKHISQPAANLLADGMVNMNWTVPDSALHRGAKVGIRFAINAGTAYSAINLINYGGEVAKASNYVQSGKAAHQNNAKFFVDVVTGTTTNGAVLPLVLSLEEDVFTPISDGASYYLCSPKGWGIGCPTTDLQLGIVVHKSGVLADTHVMQIVTSD